MLSRDLVELNSKQPAPVVPRAACVLCAVHGAGAGGVVCAELGGSEREPRGARTGLNKVSRWTVFRFEDVSFCLLDERASALWTKISHSTDQDFCEPSLHIRGAFLFLADLRPKKSSRAQS